MGGCGCRAPKSSWCSVRCVVVCTPIVEIREGWLSGRSQCNCKTLAHAVPPRAPSAPVGVQVRSSPVLRTVCAICAYLRGRVGVGGSDGVVLCAVQSYVPAQCRPMLRCFVGACIRVCIVEGVRGHMVVYGFWSRLLTLHAGRTFYHGPLRTDHHILVASSSASMHVRTRPGVHGTTFRATLGSVGPDNWSPRCIFSFDRIARCALRLNWPSADGRRSVMVHHARII
ncbi:hypothetical protein C8Q73DRAFT_458982 [Cubamyces lactineus]|nr:hypothetical protein C8Q73DRAFT_458982 [Cubamyces lactineus]